VAASIVSVGTAAVLTARQPRIYRAKTTQVVVPNSRVQGTADIIRSIGTLNQRNVLATIAQIPLTVETREKAAEALSLARGELARYTVRSRVLPNTNLITIEAQGPDPKKAADVANAFAAVTRETGRELYRIFKIDTFGQATPEGRPVFPEPSKNLLVGAVLGLFIGFVGAWLAERFRVGSHGVERELAESRGYGV
jgi:capsular polysaccharide biosynthesis protein